MGPTARRLGALLLCAPLGHCGRASETELRAEPGGWLAACLGDADCSEGSCVCGVCTATCPENECSAGPPGSACMAPGHWAQAAFCAGRSTEPICLSTCSEDAECRAADRCVDGVCLPEAAADLTEARLPPLCVADPVVYRSLSVGNRTQLELLAGCEVILGDLTLSLFPGLNASPLEALREVAGKLEVRSGTNQEQEEEQEPRPRLPLPPFPALESVGDLSLAGVELGADPLPALRELTRRDERGENAGRLALSDCTGLTDLSAFGALGGIASLNLSANPELTRLRGLSDVTDLRNLTLRANPGLGDLGGLGDTPALQSIQIDGNDGLESLAGLAPPAELRNIIVVSNGRMETLAGLEGVTHVNALQLDTMPVLRSLEGLGSLESAGSLVISDNPGLASLGGLQRLREAGSVDASRNPALLDVGEWPALESVGRLSLTDNPSLQNLVGLGAASIRLMEVWGAAITDLSGLESASVESQLSLIDNSLLATLSGAPTLGPDVEINVENSPNFADLSALSESTSVGRLALTDTAVANLDALSNLEQLGALVLQQNPNLSQIDAVSDVRGLSELVVRESSALERLPSFPSVATIVGDQFPGYGALFVELAQNPSLVEGPSFPAVDQALAVIVVGNPSLTRLIGFARLEVVQEVTLIDNPSLAEIDFSNLREALSIQVDQNPLLSAEELAPLSRLASGANSGGSP